jgi:hypothetical protein
VPFILFGERISESLIERARRELTESGIMKGETNYRMEKDLRVTSTVL